MSLHFIVLNFSLEKINYPVPVFAFCFIQAFRITLTTHNYLFIYQSICLASLMDYSFVENNVLPAVRQTSPDYN